MFLVAGISPHGDPIGRALFQYSGDISAQGVTLMVELVKTTARTTRTLSPPSPGPFLVFFCLRWIAGILENNGLAMASEAAAIVMLAGLGIEFLNTMRLTIVSALFVTGIFAWFASACFSALSNAPTDLRTSASLLSLLALYGLFANAAMGRVHNLVHLIRIQQVLVVFIVVGALLSVVQIFTGSGFVEPGRNSTQRAFGSDIHPVSLSIQLVGAMVAVEVIRVKRRLPRSAGMMLLMVIGLVALYLTFARTAWVMGLIVVGYAFLTFGPPARRAMLGLISILIGASLLGFSNRFQDLSSLPFFLANFSFDDVVFDWRYVDNSISWRIVNWSFGLNQALEYPILGHGPGQSAISSHFNLEMHNIFLETFFEGGIFGLLAFLMCVGGLIRIHRELPRHTGADAYSRGLTNGFGLSLLLAVSFSTSFVDQLMSFLIYLLLLAVTLVPAKN